MMLEIRPNPKGRGIYALADFKAGSIIEVCPILLLPTSEVLEDQVVGLYVFEWTDEHFALALGHGSLYNHSYSANAVYDRDYETGTIFFEAHRDIRAGDEICINYNGEPDDLTPVWFDVI